MTPADQLPQQPNGLELALRAALRYARRVIVLVVGGTVVLLGLVMIVTPGPALVVIPVGLAILGLEFAWARRLLRRMKAKARDAWEAARRAAPGAEQQ